MNGKVKIQELIIIIEVRIQLINVSENHYISSTIPSTNKFEQFKLKKK